MKDVTCSVACSSKQLGERENVRMGTTAGGAEFVELVRAREEETGRPANRLIDEPLSPRPLEIQGGGVVEAPGIEPGSENLFYLRLRAYPAVYFTR